MNVGGAHFVGIHDDLVNQLDKLIVRRRTCFLLVKFIEIFFISSHGGKHLIH